MADPNLESSIVGTLRVDRPTGVDPEALRFAPQEGPQTDFQLSRADIVIFGGGAGGGKSYGLLLEPLRYVTKVPEFNAVIFRRTTPQIINAGGLWDVSKQFIHSPVVFRISVCINTIGRMVALFGSRIFNTKTLYMTGMGARLPYFASMS